MNLKGNPEEGVPPIFRNMLRMKKDDDEKINYLPGTLNIGKQLFIIGFKN